jgi:cell division inhibitor SepF
MAIWKKAMDYLGLGPDDAYDEYDAAPEPEPRPARARQGREGENGARASRTPDYDEGAVRPVPPRQTFPSASREADPSPGRRPQPATDDSSVHPRPINPRQPSAPPRGGPQAMSSSDPYTVRPRRFDSAQEIADKFKEGLPVIMNLEGSDREVSRRLIDFASGLCYGLNGSMEKVATGVYLLKPVPTRASGYTAEHD